MKKTYIRPTLTVSIIQPIQMICESYTGINTTNAAASSSWAVLDKETDDADFMDDLW